MGRNGVVVVLLCMLVLAGCAQEQVEEAAPTIYDVSIDDDPIKGDPNAPITIVSFEDYECPFCAKFSRDTLVQLTEKYIETGQVKYVFRDYPVVHKHENAFNAAMAANCAREHDKYWEYHDILYENQKSLSREDLIHYARILFINKTEFTECLDSEKYKIEVQADIAAATQLGVKGTPTFFINGFKLEGAHPMSSFEIVFKELGLIEEEQ